MTDEQFAQRIAAIEAYIAQQEREGKPWSGRSIYRALGGSHAIVNDYMKARAHLHGSPRAGQRSRTPPSAAEVRQAMAQQPPTSLEEDLLAAQEAEAAAERRLAELESKAQAEMLSEQEEIESVRLERRVHNLAAVITRLETERAQAKEVVDIEAFCAAWLPTVEAKRARYAEFHQAVRQVWVALGAILAQHHAQIEGIMHLPPRLQRYLLDSFLPDTNTMKARIAQALGNAWTPVLCAPGEVRVTPPEQLMDTDPGTRPLPPRLIQNALNRGRPLERSA